MNAVGFDPRQSPLYIITAVADFNNYRASVVSGAERLVCEDDEVGMLHDQLVHCPQMRVALIGFSQGSHVIQYALSSAPSSPSAVTQQILAVLLYADPVRQPDRSYNVGNQDAHGIFSNPEVFPLLPGNSGTPEMPDYLQVVAQSYCRESDPICDQPGSDDMSIHSYAETSYVDAGVEFAVERLLVGW